MTPPRTGETRMKVKRQNVIFARTSFCSMSHGHMLEEICDDGCKSQEIQSGIPGIVHGNECVRGKIDVITCTCISKENYTAIRDTNGAVEFCLSRYFSRVYSNISLCAAN